MSETRPGRALGTVLKSRRRPTSHIGALGLAFAVALGALGCAHAPREADLFAIPEGRVVDAGPLGGAALAARRLELERAGRDLLHFRTTLSSLRRHRERANAELFGRFVDAYLGTYVDPLLAGEWQSRHPELSVLDANLRFAKADVFLRMRDPGRVQDAIDEIEARYAGRGDMLVAYPVGAQTPIDQALVLLRDTKWWNESRWIPLPTAP